MQKKSLQFENKVASFFRAKGYHKVRVREKVTGKSGVKHQVDVLVFDNLDQSQLLWACRCRQWESKVGKNQIAEWVHICQDIGARPAFAAIEFSSEARTYAEHYRVFLITAQTLTAVSDSGLEEGFASWRRKLESINNDINKIVFCLESIYKTEILQLAKKAKSEPPEELRFENPELYHLFLDPEDQRVTKFLIYINKITDKYGPSYAFGPLDESLNYAMFSRLTYKATQSKGAYPIPTEVGKVLDEIFFLLENMGSHDLETYSLNWSHRCRIFLEGWLVLSESTLLAAVCTPDWLDYTYFRNKNRTSLQYDTERRIFIGIPRDEHYKNYWLKKKAQWKTVLSGRNPDEIVQLSRLFQTDLSVINENNKLPYVNLGSRHKCLSCEMYRIARVVHTAYKRHRLQVEKLIANLVGV